MAVPARETVRRSPARRRAAAFAGSALLASGLALTLSACGSDAPAAGPPDTRPATAAVSLDRAAGPVATAVQAQATAARQAAQQTAVDQTGPKVCTTDPADRAACVNPGGTIDPRGGDLDGDGVFESHEPVGPGYKDPRAYNGGKTSGETQCEWLRSRGTPC
ncbi:hypothetical protein [Streptomyces ficellus]|uniref:Calcium-binding protein n=1 Tax=Streptomyces ficellus TaxID=1977088 RepID=A0A6I6F2S7_9ACTN|nr:hypothetical protein [Streptomyces ficellus]QGV76934.1 hypothetical protein EIZ62_00645 [Streptomyces ficellus]